MKDLRDAFSARQARDVHSGRDKEDSGEDRRHGVPGEALRRPQRPSQEARRRGFRNGHFWEGFLQGISKSCNTRANFVFPRSKSGSVNWCAGDEADSVGEEEVEAGDQGQLDDLLLLHCQGLASLCLSLCL